MLIYERHPWSCNILLRTRHNTMQMFTFLYNLPYYFYLKLPTVKKLAEFAKAKLCLSDYHHCHKRLPKTSKQSEKSRSWTGQHHDWSPHFSVENMNAKNDMSALKLSQGFKARTLCCLKMPKYAQVRTRKGWKDLMPALAANVTQPKSSGFPGENHIEISYRTTQNRTQHRPLPQPAATPQMGREVKS